jgi:hypothetical protein
MAGWRWYWCRWCVRVHPEQAPCLITRLGPEEGVWRNGWPYLELRALFDQGAQGEAEREWGRRREERARGEFGKPGWREEGPVW